MYSSYKTNWRSLKSKWDTYTNPRPDQYLTHVHSHVTPAVAAMDSSVSTFPLACVQTSPLPLLRRGDVCTQATFPCRFYVTILPTSPSFLFPEARSHWSVPLIWSILGASRKDHNSCHKISFSFLLLWDSVTHRRLFSIPGSTHFILIPEVYKRFSISGLLLWFVLSFQVISLSHTETCYLLRFLAIFNRWTLIVKRLQPP